MKFPVTYTHTIVARKFEENCLAWWIWKLAVNSGNNNTSSIVSSSSKAIVMTNDVKAGAWLQGNWDYVWGTRFVQFRIFRARRLVEMEKKEVRSEKINEPTCDNREKTGKSNDHIDRFACIFALLRLQDWIPRKVKRENYNS